jgi:eukaryotic-like serine/threonine-protein kinase
VMYEMVAGEPPFTGPTARSIITRSLTEKPRSLTVSRAGLPPAVDSAVMKALAKSAADRYASAQEMVGALERSMEGVHSGTSEYAVPSGPTPMQVWGLFGLGCVGMLALVSVLVRQWSLPRWTLGLAVVLLAIGAGVLVLTRRMETLRHSGGAIPAIGRFFTWRFAALGGVMSLLLWSGVAMLLAFTGPRAGAARAGGNHLAILPFENQGGADDAYFADGIADEVRGKLARVSGITVIASSSASQYRASTKAPQEIAKELGADYLLVGKVRWAGPVGGTRRVQVVPELVDGRTGSTTWQQSFDTDVTDVFEVQSQIATRVASALGAQLGSQEERELAERPTASVAAYDLYLKGKALTSVDAGTMRLAASYFEQAVALDSTFVDAWAALSRSLSRVFTNGSRDPVVAARSREAMERAIALDPSGPSGYTAAARFYSSVVSDAAKASAALERALRLAPNDADVLSIAAGVDLRLGHTEAATIKLERARELDPRSGATLGSLQQAYLVQRRFAEAIDAGQAAMALVPGDVNLVEWQAMAHLGQGDLQGARGVIRAAIDRGNAAPAVAAFFGGYQELSWVLEAAEREVMFRLTPAAFDNDRGWWGQTMATAYWQQGNEAPSKAYADSALRATEAQLAASPEDGQSQALHGVVLAYLGRKNEAIAEGIRAISHPVADVTDLNYNMMQMIRIYLAVGEPEKALDQLEVLLRRPYVLTPAWLRIDPTFRTLKGNPRFERMTKGN